jgi:uncharacterized protein
MRSDVKFNSAGLRLVGHLYSPDDGGAGPHPAIVVSHPASGVKEQAGGLYASRLAKLGFITLTFDAAYQSESEGAPRGFEDPFHRVEDILRDAIAAKSEAWNDIVKIGRTHM